MFVCRPELDIDDGDWQRYVAWLKALQAKEPVLKVLTAPGGRAPNAAQRRLLNEELRADSLRVAVMLSDPKLLVVVRITSWFIKNTEAFGANELGLALKFLGADNVAEVRAAIRALGGVVPEAAG